MHVISTTGIHEVKMFKSEKDTTCMGHIMAGQTANRRKTASK